MKTTVELYGLNNGFNGFNGFHPVWDFQSSREVEFSYSVYRLV
jgi:hypothetical protein